METITTAVSTRLPRTGTPTTEAAQVAHKEHAGEVAATTLPDVEVEDVARIMAATTKDDAVTVIIPLSTGGTTVRSACHTKLMIEMPMNRSIPCRNQHPMHGAHRSKKRTTSN